jgi:hypothetical protein
MNMIARKIIAASLTGPLFFIIMGLLDPNPFGGTMETAADYLHNAVWAIPVYLMYGFPVLLIYGVATSVVSDKLSGFAAKKWKNEQLEVIGSGILHVVFGLVMFPYSLGASVLFFVTDRMLMRVKKEYPFFWSIVSLIIPLVVWLVFVLMIHLIDGMSGS